MSTETSFLKNIDEMLTSDCHSCRATRVHMIIGVFVGVFAMFLVVAHILTGGPLKGLIYVLMGISGAVGYFLCALRRNIRAQQAEDELVIKKQEIYLLNDRVSRLGEQVRNLKCE